MFMGGDDATVTRKDLRASGWRIVKGVDKITKNINDVLLNSESDNGYKAQFTNNTRVRDKKRLEKVGNLVKNSYLYR